MEKIFLLYIRNRRTSLIIFFIIFFIQLAIGIALHQNVSYLSNFTHLMYLPVTISAFIFPLSISLMQGIMGGVIIGTTLFLTYGTLSSENLSLTILALSYYLSAALIIGFLKDKIVKFYLRQENIFYVDEFSGLPNMSAFVRDINQMEKKSDIHYVQMVLVEIVNQCEISAAFGMDTLIEMQKKLGSFTHDFFKSEVHVYQICLNTLVVLFPPNFPIDFQTIKERPTQIMQIKGVPIFFDIVCGACKYPQDGSTANELLKNGYLAIQEAHQQKQLFLEYEPSLQVTQKIVLLGQIQSAFKEKEINFYYQPVLDAVGDVHSVEALIRWTHPQYGMLNPSEFIPDLEITGIAETLLDYSLDYNLDKLRCLLREGINIKMAINISVTNLQQGDFSERVLAALEKFTIPPSNLILEITERGFLADLEESIWNIKNLSEYGISFHIDDFGVGFTSIGNLHKQGIRSIKIDRSFVVNLPEDKINYAVVSNVISMAKEIDIRTIAEGIETDEQLTINNA